MINVGKILLPPVSLYIHMPWCIKKCPYCDFNSHQLPRDFSEKDYVRALLNDLKHRLPLLQNRPLKSIFFGGGTPSIFSAESFNFLLSEIKNDVDWSPSIEITMEANPGTFEQDKFVGFNQAGINRLSIGIQSFQLQHLQKLGRIHNPQEALSAVFIAKEAGFKNINLDLMFALPNQTLEQAMADLKTAVDLAPQHISWYQLTLEPNTVFYYKPPPLPDEALVFDIQTLGQKYLSENEFYQYEVSAYSKPNKNCVHNRNYWEFGDYLGVGAGAHSKITTINKNSGNAFCITRLWNAKQPKTYVKRLKTINSTPFGSEKNINDQELPFEFMMNVLRLKNGIPADFFKQRTGLNLNQIKNQLNIASRKKLLKTSGNKIKASELGYRFLNDLLSIFL